ncbi:MAG: ATPase BadF/BadG/BcrA/BcrD type [Candidatus Beckwithbacteria bacterium GW2011_GWA2_43_10]|uniref:ATPase BadF/BadG/BcrA/BcrD type n=1 Tax=Candidatus Beckwithbacteria bacterium GW2011_GWA2_43_10 TaxID=1618369 RepID=A0A0G1EA46_9BACT|nr:MAG: ATPase BadF/BadG/BcrA/BcrD type [Candidatus Beckwithbacteria bacterium GW2011_GWA2_43_10]
MKTLGIDFGASFVDAVIFDGKKILKTWSVEKSKFTNNWLKQLTGNTPVATTREKNELECLGRGGLWLAKLSSAVVVSCGTGTAVVWARKNQPIIHLGGTGVGGGTIQGLGKLLLKTKTVEKIFKLAEKGDKTKVDLTVGDILGQGIGLLPPEATAANFGKLNSFKKEDLAQSLIGMVAETIGLVSSLAAGRTEEKKIVFTGRVSTNKLIQKYLSQVCSLFKLSPVFPDQAESATALGAALAG